MPTVDEAAQDRQDYAGNRAGWSGNTTNSPPTGNPVTPPVQDAPADSSSADAEAASSAEPQESQEPVAEPQADPSPVEPAPEKWNVPPKERWEERQRELEALRRQNQQLFEMAQRVVQQPAVPIQGQPPKDPWEGLVGHPDPATAQFYQQLRQVVQYERQQAKQEAIQELAPVIDAGRQELARLNIREFRKDNPDIKPGSEEEASIVAYMEGRVDGVRHPLDSAKRNALYDRLETENRALKQKQAAVPQKRSAAAAEPSAGIPQTAGLPRKPGDWRQSAADVLDKGGSTSDAAAAIFGKRR